VTVAEDTLERGRGRANEALERWLPDAETPPQRLHAAMRYAVLGTGKRLRPALVYAAGEAVGGDRARLDPPACAVELIHAYSLAHDDLPAMDNDDLRRGAATCHRAFDEATAILDGDALQALAFELVTCEPAAHALAPATRGRLAGLLAHAAGASGMAGGQALDLAASGQAPAFAEVERMHRYKTGALIRASVLMGGAAADADETVLAALARYGEAIGLAFQIVDDILDVTADTATLGKTQGSDDARAKPTYPAVLGLDGARTHAATMRDEALESLAHLDSPFEPLRALARFVVERSW
jgi:geranylgeranyl pyrophosphate synthase